MTELEIALTTDSRTERLRRQMSLMIEGQMRSAAARLTRELLDLKRLGYTQDEVAVAQDQSMAGPFVTLKVFLGPDGPGRNQLRGR